MADLHFPNANTRATALLDVGLALGCRPKRYDVLAVIELAPVRRWLLLPM